MKPLRQCIRQCINLVLETPCPLCQRSSSDEWCLDCQRRIQRCQFAQPQQFQPGHPSIFAWGRYQAELKQAIAALKYENKPYLAAPLAHWLAQAWLSSTTLPALSKPLTVVPIPMHTSKQLERGFNQAELLAEAFCRITRLPLARQGLKRSRATVAQFQLSHEERTQNLAGAFCLGPDFLRRCPGGSVLLLDDIYTTGATVQSATQTLRRRGIPVFGIAVVARAEMEVNSRREEG